ncbi:hypothetical protein F53441_9601 [Fusarium austroafricanum]|uniref:VOC domain-containing protein n=1 Tax=Fusarium austroafricanum TaxID=2364996 RepID=A0A8H4KB74_9HYPO|nr:hypothetical protein F53441_9601 [Fusarium austroafricanum]
MQSDSPKAPSFYLNVQTSDPNAGLEFYTALGFVSVKEYSDDKTKAFRLPGPNHNICLMIHANARFTSFIRPGTQATDPTKMTESLFSIAVEDKEAVDKWLSKAVEAGGIADPYIFPNYGAECGMYTRSFADLDGHIWEIVATIGSCGGENADS